MARIKPDTASELRALVILGEKRDEPPMLVWGISSVERLRRSAIRMGASIVDVLEPSESVPADTKDSDWIVLRADLFYDERILTGLRETRDVMLCDALEGETRVEALAAHVHGRRLEATVDALRGRGAREAGDGATESPTERRVSKLDLAPAYNAQLRKFEEPFVHRADRENTRKIENAIYSASYKGVTDFVTKWVWPLPARAAVRKLAARQIRPNSVTAIGYVLTILATWFFMEGWFAAGLAAGWLMTFLDTVDGKLARCTLTSSPIGNVLDHGLDLVHPPFWWAAWAWGVSPNFVGLEFATFIVIVGYVTGRLLEGVFLLFFKQELFTWRRFDIFFRTIIARRNPNLVILSAFTWAGRPGDGFLAVAAWTVVANVVPAIRIGQAFSQQRSGHPIRPWYEEAQEETARPTGA